MARKQLIKSLPSTVLILGTVSFFTDLSSEMIYPLLPLFLTTVLGAGPLTLGLIEGGAESLSSLLKIASGLWTDRTRKRKPLILAGYSLSGLMRPLIGLAPSWPWVLMLRFSDRIGKGIRTSPRDVLIAQVTPLASRGRAFGFHRAMDHAGAVLGPLVAALLLTVEGVSLRHVFVLAAIPSILVIVLLVLGLRDRPVPDAGAAGIKRAGGGSKQLGSRFRWLLAAIFIFTLGNSSDAFILLLLSGAGVAGAWIAVLWSLHHVVKMFSSYLGGTLSDRWGRKNLLVGAWWFYALAYLGFAIFDSEAALIAVFLVYGLYFGLSEPAEKAWVADLVPESMRGTAFGYYHGIIGITALPASLIFGAVWQTMGAPVAFLLGAVLAVMASLFVLRIESRGSASVPPAS